ncbi:MAG TPA: helicase-related protein [Roseiflexaceae bacterium]|nr:helicase-related protein [Roseiflexaceae bacterium]
MPKFEIGSIVHTRGREWVVLPSDEDEVLLLRPLGGIEAETCGIYLPLEGSAVQPAAFAPPDPDHAGDFVSGRLLRDAARLTLRSGAGPFRSLGRLGIRPRPYQLVPLIMALRLDPVRLLIADDVGVGKTIEAGLIVRELLDRGEIRRLTVLCPPHLCDQWQRELAAKFAIDAVVVRSSTAAALERALPRGDVSIFEYFPFTVTSIDYVKSDRRRDSFLRACPELVIVDEAHSATDASGRGTQQQRYELVRELSGRPDRHMLLLTATPHSGIEDAFRSLLRLLAPHFGQLDVGRLAEAERDELARHFVQRRRGDVARWLGEDTPFPARESAEVTYQLARASEYRKLFEDVYDFTRELVRDTSGSRVRQRARYWAALALLRCVMSSPAAAAKALQMRAGSDEALAGDDELGSDDLFSGYVYDPTEQEAAQDLEPGHVVEQGSPTSERARLRRFAERAAQLEGGGDPKLLALVPVVEELLRAGFNPIVYCRYIATANYLAADLGSRLKGYGNDLRVVGVTGERSEEEREALIAELERNPRRVLVATDCLSEGINLQQAFDAVIHYDLPWNPNRLEQREGRVDRYGQPAARVRTVLLYGQDNPMDEAVMKVLLRKAVSIHRSLGISVPLPIDSGTVVETLIASLFQPAPRQLSLFDTHEQSTMLDADEQVQQVERAWNRAVEREKESRTRFAQRRIKPEEVARELEESDAVLGDAAAVQRFVHEACARFGAPLRAERKHLLLPLGPLPQTIRERLAPLLPRQPKGAEADLLRLVFDEPALQGVELIGRNHPLTTALADYLLETALTPESGTPLAARCGLVRTAAVARRTVLLLLRVRMLIESPRQAAQTLAEELVVVGYTRGGGVVQWLDEPAALELLATAQPSANVTRDERSLGVQSALDQLGGMGDALNDIAQQRAARLRESHQRVRGATTGGKVTVTPRTPPDVLGVYVLLPVT